MKILSTELTPEALNAAVASLPPGTEVSYVGRKAVVEFNSQRFESSGHTWPEAIRDALIQALTFHFAPHEHFELPSPKHPFQIAA